MVKYKDKTKYKNMDIKQILNNKKTYYILAGVVSLGAIIYLAIFFGVGDLFKGDLPIIKLPITCAATPSEIPLDGKSHDVTWKAYSVGGSAKGDWSGYLPGLPSQIGVSQVDAHYLGQGQDGDTRTVTVTGDPATYSPNTADCSITFKKTAPSNITLLNNNIQFQQIGGCSPAGSTRIDPNNSSCSETCQADGTWGLKICAVKINIPAGTACTYGVDSTVKCTIATPDDGMQVCLPTGTTGAAWSACVSSALVQNIINVGVKNATDWGLSCAPDPLTAPVNTPVSWKYKMTAPPSNLKKVFWLGGTGSGLKNAWYATGNPVSHTYTTTSNPTFATLVSVTTTTLIPNTQVPNYAAKFCTPIKITAAGSSGVCTNGSTQPCNNGSGEQTCTGGQWGSCISTGAEPPGTEPPGAEPPGAEPPGVEPPGVEPPGVEPPGAQTGTAFNNMQISDSLKDEQELITCNGGPDTFSAKQNESISVRCTLLSTNTTVKKPLLTAKIVKGAFDPANGIASKNDIIKNFMDDLATDQGAVSLTWNGKRYGQPVDPGEYTFIMAARLSKDYNYNYFLKKFSVTEESARAPAATEPTIQAPQEQVSTINQQPAPAQQPQVEQPTIAPPEPSKCPGVNYPSDIKGHWAEALIKTAVDDCKSTGFADGTWRPDRNITRFEAVKLIVAEIGQPKSCYDADCGTPFVDLSMSMGPWVRAAWDMNISKGFGIYFLPNRPVSRAEAAAMIVRAFPQKLQTFRGCYTPNCGAGHPNNLFVDIYDSWSGKYIRALWDKGLIKGTGPYMFEPDRAITRAEFLKLVMSAKAL
ncbi:MAG: S-layer homology domain-containing protein [Firmicutes bacterium]|nr:S-layer homology domain-containing protein [Bacillota bacterium]